MMIGLASELKMIDGAFVLDALPESRLREGSRRVASRRTLDGGVVVLDGGFAHGDRVVRLSVASSGNLWERLWSFFQIVLSATVSLDDGCFTATLETVSENNGIITIGILLKEKISA